MGIGITRAKYTKPDGVDVMRFGDDVGGGVGGGWGAWRAMWSCGTV